MTESTQRLVNAAKAVCTVITGDGLIELFSAAKAVESEPQQAQPAISEELASCLLEMLINAEHRVSREEMECSIERARHALAKHTAQGSTNARK